MVCFSRYYVSFHALSRRWAKREKTTPRGCNANNDGIEPKRAYGTQSGSAVLGKGGKGRSA